MRSIYIWLLSLVVVVAPGIIGCASASTPPVGLAAPRQALPPPPVEVRSAVAATVAPEPEPVAVVEPPPEAMVPDTTDRDLAVAWMMGFMTKNAPPGRQTFYVEAQETKEEALVRYRGIADAIVDVVFDPKSKPLFKGASGRARSASVILAIMLYESGFMKNVDYGVGKFGRGDNGNSWCLLQVNIGSGKTLKWNTKEDRPARWDDPPGDIFGGYTGPELVSDRKKCVGEAYKAMRLSFTSCRAMNLPLDQKLRVYGSGNCNGAEKGSRLRMQTAIKFWDESVGQRTFKDKAIVASIEQSQLQKVVQGAPDPAPAPPKPQPVEKPKDRNQVPHPTRDEIKASAVDEPVARRDLP